MEFITCKISITCMTRIRLKNNYSIRKRGGTDNVHNIDYMKNTYNTTNKDNRI